MKQFSFSITSELNNSKARVGTISTPHGDIKTPAFITVGTAATVKALTPEQVASVGAQAVLANTYHLYLRPGEAVVKKASGLHKFMHWQGPMFTDSGGFQVFSLGEAFGKGISKVATGDNSKSSVNERMSQAKKAKITDEGVTFYSHIDGSKHVLTPEKSMQIQHTLGADIIFAFDECTSPHAKREYQEIALQRTHTWAKRSLVEHQKLNAKQAHYQALYGVVQGGQFKDLREYSATTLGDMEFDGFGIGGSFTKDDIATAVGWVTDKLPKDKPRHLLGMAEVIDLFEGIEAGIDTFDCVSPTRIARNGTVFTKNGRISLGNASYRQKLDPIEENCRCYTCQNFTCAYLHHLVKAQEMLSATLLSIHNLYFITHLVDLIRESIENNTFYNLKKDVLSSYYAE
ncbi:MAG: tRNA guanosine(34) transglycosylase Tgt [Candidatus Saccharibacteria bacterium]